MKRIVNYRDFYRYYLREHQEKSTRILHFIGTFLALLLVVFAVVFQWGWQWLLVPIVGYGFAWIGHAFFEKNKPATFRYPLWSLVSDFKLFFEICLGRRSFDSSKDDAATSSSSS
ncbi:MAG: DUF962 domain-containing protein [Flavobacteriaceae bacterium]|nr:DUF962 domain-containing protein [Flavobacteriaceae bacterium]